MSEESGRQTDRGAPHRHRPVTTAIRAPATLSCPGTLIPVRCLGSHPASSPSPPSTSYCPLSCPVWLLSPSTTASRQSCLWRCCVNTNLIGTRRTQALNQLPIPMQTLPQLPWRARRRPPLSGCATVAPKGLPQLPPAPRGPQLCREATASRVGSTGQPLLLLAFPLRVYVSSHLPFPSGSPAETC